MPKRPKLVPPGYYRLERSPVGFKVIKYHHKSGLEESRYDLIEDDGQLTCNCPQMAKETCRHRQMYPALTQRVDTGWFYLFPAGQWEDLLGLIKTGELVDEANGEGETQEELHDEDVLAEALGLTPQVEEGYDPAPEPKLIETEHGLKVPETALKVHDKVEGRMTGNLITSESLGHAHRPSAGAPNTQSTGGGGGVQPTSPPPTNTEFIRRRI